MRKLNLLKMLKRQRDYRLSIFKLKFLVVAWILSLMVGCSNLGNHSKTAKNEFKTPQANHDLNDISHLSMEDRGELYKNIIAADLAFFQKDYELATSYYLASAKMAKSTDLIKLSITSAKKSGDVLAILQASDLWLSFSPKNTNALTLKISGLLLHQDLIAALNETSILLDLQRNERDRFLLLDDISTQQSPRVMNVYFARLSQVYTNSPAIQTAWANYMQRYALQTKKPKTIYSQALTIVNQALELQGDFLPAIDLKTRIFYQTKRDAQAEAFLRSVLLAYPDSKEAALLLGQLLYDLKKYPLAEQQYKTLLKQFSDSHEARFYLGAIYFATNRFDQSLQQYRKLLGKPYKTQTTYFFCGSAAAQLKEYAQAIACYDLVSKGNYLSRSKVELAKLYALNKDYSKALNTVRNPKFKTNQESTIRLLNVEIEIVRKQQGEEEAQKLLAESLTNYPANFSLLLKKIRYESLVDKPESLKTLFSEAIHQSKIDEEKNLEDSQLQQLNLTIAAFFQANHHYQFAVNWLNDALALDKENTEYLYTRALYKEPLGLHDEMVDDFKELLKLQPDNSNIKNALGYTLVDINKELDYASGLIEAAFIEMPNNAAVIDSKGWLAYRKGFLKQAIKYLTASFRLAPSAEVAVHLAEVYWKMDDKKQSEFYFKKAETLQPDNYLLKITRERLGIPEKMIEKEQN